MVLNLNGFDAVAAYNGERGLELARLTGYDHLVTDVMMEPMNGIQVSLAMRAISPKCTMLLISGNERTSNLLADAIRDGQSSKSSPKPVHPSVILDHLRASSPSACRPELTPEQNHQK
jgi:DNA-binding NtrC family response regulator